jgi:transketolase
VDEKFEAFGCKVVEIDGNDFDELEHGFKKFHKNIGKGKPTVILMRTIKGKDVSYMENQVGWHGKAPNDEEYAIGMADLAAIRKQIEEA